MLIRRNNSFGQINRMIARAVVATGLLLASGTAAAGVSVGAGLEYFYWREYDDFEHRELLDETGPRAVATLELSAEVARKTDLLLRGKVYGGEVDYDGQFQDGTPTTSTTRYQGISAEAGLGFKPQRSGRDATSMILALGVDNWTRDLQGTGGYEEEYTVTFLRIGAESVGRPWRARGGLLLPLDVDEHVEVFGGFDLKPDPSPWFYLGVGYQLTNQIELAIDYQGYRFDNSDPEGVDANRDGVVSLDEYFYQPRSDQDTLAATLRVNF